MKCGSIFPYNDESNQQEDALHQRGRLDYIVIEMPEDFFGDTVIEMTDDPLEFIRQPGLNRINIFAILLFDHLWRYIARALRLQH